MVRLPEGKVPTRVHATISTNNSPGTCKLWVIAQGNWGGEARCASYGSPNLSTHAAFEVPTMYVDETNRFVISIRFKNWSHTYGMRTPYLRVYFKK